MDNAELHAYGLVAQAIAKHVFAWAEREDKDSRIGFPDAAWPIFYHLSTSNLEAAAEDLWRLRILRPLDEDKDWAYHFVFDCVLDDAQLVARQNWKDGPPFSELLVTFISLFGDFGTEYWGFSTEPFKKFGSKSKIAPTLDALVTTRHLRRVGNDYVWTELAAPAMYKAGYWPAHNETAQ